MSIEDPGIWKQVSGWLWAVLAAPMAMLWRRSENSVQKDDFKDFSKELLGRFDQHIRDDREIQAKLFDKIDEVKTIVLERVK